jgi:hypothetical protein
VQQIWVDTANVAGDVYLVSNEEQLEKMLAENMDAERRARRNAAVQCIVISSPSFAY